MEAQGLAGGQRLRVKKPGATASAASAAAGAAGVSGKGWLASHLPPRPHAQVLLSLACYVSQSAVAWLVIITFSH